MLRHHFRLPDPPETVEFRAFTHGLMPHTVPTMMDRFVEDWHTRGVDAWNEVPNHWVPGSDEPVGWWTLPTYLGDAFIAPMLQAPTGTCILQPNVHWTMLTLLTSRGLFDQHDEVVLTAAEFPSVGHTLQHWADLLGLRLRVVPLDEAGFVEGSRVLEAITPRTGLVILSHVGFTTGQLLRTDLLRAAADRVHGFGGLAVVDGYHATGSIPVDVDALGADVYMGGLLKEASGSSGNAYVYLRPGLDLVPRATGWFGDADPFGFQPSPAPHPDVRQRFQGGTTAVASMYHAVEGLRLLLDTGLEAVRAASLALTDRAIARIDEAGLPLRSPRDRAARSAMVILEVEGADRLCAWLKQRHVYTDSRQGRYLRLAPFVWNTDEEVDRTFALISEALASGRYLETDAHVATGPVT
ncbi:MAG: aminotransferase class V-fold PLP-dependent enzyme [Bacteroidota bacterium]